MSDELADTSDSFYSFVPEQGMILLDNDIINLRRANAIRKIDGRTLVYFSGVAEPLVLPGKAFDDICDNVFAIDDVDDEEDFEDDDEA